MAKRTRYSARVTMLVPTSLLTFAMAAVLACGGSDDGAAISEDVAGVVAAKSPAPPAESRATPTPAPTSTPLPPTRSPEPLKTAFGDGTHIVGTDIAPGTYITPTTDGTTRSSTIFHPRKL